MRPTSHKPQAAATARRCPAVYPLRRCRCRRRPPAVGRWPLSCRVVSCRVAPRRAAPRRVAEPPCRAEPPRRAAAPPRNRAIAPSHHRAIAPTSHRTDEPQHHRADEPPHRAAPPSPRGSRRAAPSGRAAAPCGAAEPPRRAVPRLAAPPSRGAGRRASPPRRVELPSRRAAPGRASPRRRAGAPAAEPSRRAGHRTEPIRPTDHLCRSAHHSPQNNLESLGRRRRHRRVVEPRAADESAHKQQPQEAQANKHLTQELRRKMHFCGACGCQSVTPFKPYTHS